MRNKYIFQLILSVILLLPLMVAAEENMYVMSLGKNWEIEGDLPTHAMLVSLQGIANTDAPRLYFLYPEDWDFKFSAPLLNYYQRTRKMDFDTLQTVEDALEKLAQYAKGYVVWDKSVRTSLIVSFTVAGLEKAIVVSEELIPLVEKFGLKKTEDFRGKFVGKTDYEIYQWAFEKYWQRCNHEYLIYMGGHAGKVMKPGVADFGILKQAFFTDASTDPADTLEFQFANKVFGHMKPLSMVMGWHSYGKDLEAQHVSLASQYALRVEGLHTLPNMSFNSQIPTTPGYRFKNNHNVKPGKTYKPENKVYISFIQTDCLGLGAWTEPGRGDIPYAWEVTMNWVWLAPAMMQFFYDEATPNDYFLGSLGGPGYMYPRSIPKKYLPLVVKKAYELMNTLDLNVFEIMEHSNYWQSGGVDDDVPEEIIDAYYKGMPDAIGFVSGYRPGHTFTVKGGRPFISFDYYLSEKRDEDEAASDLIELANMNKKRPYFLLIHVREFGHIERVKRILAKLGDEFELVPLDVFLKMAGENFTFKIRYGQE
ncbi:hypothetical protein B6D60_10750 [candidate division KSB1 bacterium 4484_87]|nr:MAG: hypothetical protein B6D60_10750 [candidate division KSB1 bacterium 4484_87]